MADAEWGCSCGDRLCPSCGLDPATPVPNPIAPPFDPGTAYYQPRPRPPQSVRDIPDPAPSKCEHCVHDAHLGMCTARNGGTANPCPCMKDRAASSWPPPVPPHHPPTGLYDKYQVSRRDGTSLRGEKHEHCDYFVLDWEHDPFAIPAARAYADACEKTHPILARDLRARASRAELAADERAKKDRP